MSEKLKPCPSCGATNVFVEKQEPVFFATCAYCNMHGPETLRKKGAIDEWNALPRRLRFSKEKPTEPDFYWNRDGRLLRIGEILEISVALWCHFAGESEPQLLELVGGEWAGPIPEPEEATT